MGCERTSIPSHCVLGVMDRDIFPGEGSREAASKMGFLERKIDVGASVGFFLNGEQIYAINPH